MNYPINIMGTRHGEKLFEVLLSREEIVCAEDLGAYYRIPPNLFDLNYSKFMEQGEEKISLSKDYNSHNTVQLDVKGMKALLRKLDFIHALEKGEYIKPED